MPLTPTAPGVYIREEASGIRTITGVSTSTAAFLGRTRRGPVDTPVVVNSFGEFERAFGGLWADTPLGYAVQAFFLNGGAQAVVVRVFGVPASGTGVASLVVGGLHLSAAEPGLWGDSLSVTLDRDGITEDVAQRFGLGSGDLFNLTVNGDGQIERHANLSVVDGPRRVDRVLAQMSRLVRALPSGLPTTNPAVPADGGTTVGPERAGGGGDGVPLTAATLTGSQQAKTGLYALDQTDIFNLLCIPPDTFGGDVPATVYQAAAAYCVQRRAVVLVDPPHDWDPVGTDPATVLAAYAGTDGRNAALYFPYLLQSDPLRGGAIEPFAPSGAVAGVIARTDAQRGIWKAPAGIDASVSGAAGVATSLTDAENGRLNPLGINCLRTLPGAGLVVWGARTLRGSDQVADDYKYLPVRRLALFIEESLYRGSRWAVFEPNDEPLWSQLRLNVGVFLHELFRQGAFAGRTPREAYYVKCDRETTTAADTAAGVVNLQVGFAPLRPAEFVIITISQIAGQLQA